MPRKDPEKLKEYKREWERKNKEKRRWHKREWARKNKEKISDKTKERYHNPSIPNYYENNKAKVLKYQKDRYRKKQPNARHHDAYYDFETHRELAMSSGIRTHREWRECCKMGLIPNGIYSSPDRVFRRKQR